MSDTLFMYRYRDNVARFIDRAEDAPAGVEVFTVSAWVVPFVESGKEQVRIIHPLPHIFAEWGGVDAALVELIARHVPLGARYHVMRHVEIPHSRRLRNAWEMIDDAIRVNAERARALLISRAEIEADWWEPIFRSMARRAFDFADFADRVFDLPNIVERETIGMDADALEDYIVPFPAVPDLFAAKFTEHRANALIDTLEWARQIGGVPVAIDSLISAP